MKSLRYLPILCLLLVGCRDAGPAPQPVVEALLELINERLLIMPDVAKAKVDLGLPVEDAKREDALLQAAEVDAAKSGLDVGFVRQFFTAQFDAGKLVQKKEISLRPRPEPTEAGLKQAGQRLEEARAKINSINVKMLTALFNVNKLPAETRRQIIAERAPIVLGQHDPTIRDTAIAPLLTW